MPDVFYYFESFNHINALIDVPCTELNAKFQCSALTTIPSLPPSNLALLLDRILSEVKIKMKGII